MFRLIKPNIIQPTIVKSKKKRNDDKISCEDYFDNEIKNIQTINNNNYIY